MKKYEGIIIMKPLENKEERAKIVDRFKNLLSTFSNEKVKVEDLGTRKLAYKSNPSLFEWIQSPIVYLKDENFNKLKDVFYNYFSIKNISNHYYHMAENQYRKYIDKKEVFNVKKYFYVLRTIFSAKYVIEKDQMSPIQFDKLRKIIAPDNINNQIDDLLKIKISAVENKSIERNNEIENYLNNLFDEVKEKINELEKEPKKDWKLLNDTFKDLVSFYNC